MFRHKLQQHLTKLKCKRTTTTTQLPSKNPLTFTAHLNISRIHETTYQVLQLTAKFLLYPVIGF